MFSMPIRQVQGSFDWTVHFKWKTFLSQRMDNGTFWHTKQILLTWPSWRTQQYSAVSMGLWSLLPLLAVLELATSTSLVRRQVSKDFSLGFSCTDFGFTARQFLQAIPEGKCEPWILRLSLGRVSSLPRDFPQASPQLHPLRFLNPKVSQTVEKP